MQPYIDTCLIVLSLIMVNTSAAVCIFYRPKDLLPHTYDTLKWVAFVSGIIGVFILANYVTAICCFILSLAYPLVYKHCYTDIDSPQDFAEIGMESAAVSILAWALSFALRPIPFSASILVLALIVYFTCRVYAAFYRAEAISDTEKKQRFLANFGELAYPLARLLIRYHPDWYPPPVNRIIANSIVRYATVIRDLDKANGIQPNNTPDYELISLGFLRRTFPEAWNYERASDFCYPIFDIAETLRLCAELPLEMQAKYESELMHIFDQDRLPSELEVAINPILEKQDFTQPESEIAYTEARLTALIPEYIAQTKTVIGTPPDGLPVAYNSLESRYRHTFLIGRSGAGKSTVITNLVAQDMHKGYGVIVMSPDANLLHRIVPYIPEHRLDDVIYVDPGDNISPIIGFNPLSFDAPSDPRECDRLKRLKAGENYAVLMRTLNIDTEPTKNLLNHTMYALTGRPNTTLNDLRRLIDPKERTLHLEIANDSGVDEITREFWRSYAAEGANTMVYRNLSSRIVSLLRPPLFDIFSTQSFSFHRELNERARIMLIDLSNMGSRDSQEAKIASQLLIATIHQTMLKRDKMKESDYIPYFMYIDEFQQYADTNEGSISAMAEQIRKYHFGLTLTSLVVSDLSTSLFDKITGVMSTFICLSMSAKDARRFADEMSIKREDRDSFNHEALQKLKVGEAYVKTPPLDAAVYVHMPQEPIGNLPKGSITLQQLQHRSKANFGAIEKPLTPSAVYSDTPTEHVEEPKARPTRQQAPKTEPPKTETPLHTELDTEAPTPEPEISPAPKPPPQNKAPKTEPTRPAKRKKRNRFDEDVGDAEIEVF